MIRHGTALIVGFVGSGLIALPAWLRPFLQPQYMKAFDAVTSRLAHPATYEHLAVAFFGCCLLYASFLAWNEERDDLEGLLQQQPSTEPHLEATLWPSHFVYPDDDWPYLKMHVEIINRGAPTIVDRYVMWATLPSGKKLMFKPDPAKSAPCFFDNKPLHRGNKLVGDLISESITDLDRTESAESVKGELWFQDFLHNLTKTTTY